MTNAVSTLETSLRAVVGDWTGTNRKRMMPTDDYTETPATAAITIAAQGNAVTFAYTWAEEGKPQDGVLLITNGDAPGSVRAVWVDSWHQSPQWMELSGSIDDGGVIRLEGTYPEDNRWRVIIDPTDADQVRMAMDNVMPSYDVDYQVVEAAYKRAE
jgi:hypothetical protein